MRATPEKLTAITPANRVVAALALPSGALVNQRISKKLLLEHGAAFTPADRRRVQDGIDELLWVAALKPATVGIPVYRDEVREYSEIAVLAVTLRPGANAERVAQLIHRAVPHPVLLAVTQAATVTLSLAHKRLSQSGADQRVLETVEVTESIAAQAPDSVDGSFLDDLALSGLSTRDMHATYQAWMDRVTAHSAARITGRYRSPSAPDAFVSRDALDEHTRLSREIAMLRAQALKERQLARRVELNLAIRRLDARRAELVATL